MLAFAAHNTCNHGVIRAAARNESDLHNTKRPFSQKKQIYDISRKVKRNMASPFLDVVKLEAWRAVPSREDGVQIFVLQK
jgi:hypothetical protein